SVATNQTSRGASTNQVYLPIVDNGQVPAATLPSTDVIPATSTPSRTPSPTLTPAITSTATLPSPRADHVAIWTGSQMIVWGGYNGGDPGVGARFNPTTNSWQSMSTVGASSAYSNSTAVWTGTEMIFWGGVASGGPVQGVGARYNPSSDTWTRVTMV